ncbi:hypothetical protein Hanom_Chr00s006415g01733601 [Helianthus anomalus]
MLFLILVYWFVLKYIKQVGWDFGVGLYNCGWLLVLVAAFIRVSEVRSCLLSAYRIGGLMWKRLAL